MSHNGMIGRSSHISIAIQSPATFMPVPDLAGAVETGSSGGSRDDIRNLEENTIGHAGSAKIPHSISVLH